MARRTSQFTRGRTTQRRRVWADLQPLGSAVTTVQEHDLLQNWRSDGGASMGVTIMGVILQITAGKSSGTGTVGNGFRIGITIANLTATTLSPVSQPHVDWMWNKFYAVGDLSLSLAYESDHEERIKSRRRLDEVEDTAILYVEPELAGAAGLNYKIHARTLLLLP